MEEETQPEMFWLSNGEMLSREEWWAQRWGIVLGENNELRAVPYPEALSLLRPDMPVHFSVTLANQQDAERMIAAITAYCAYLSTKQ